MRTDAGQQTGLDSLAAEGRAMFTADLESRLAVAQVVIVSLVAKSEGLERLVEGFKSSHAALKGYVRQIEDTGHAKDGVILAAEAKIALLEGRLQIGEELQTLQGEEVRQRKALLRAEAKARKFDE